MREEAFLRLFPDDAKAIGKFPGNFDKALKDAPELMGELFTSADIQKLRQFRNVIANVVQKAPGAVNFSNTTAALSRLAQDVFGNSGTILSFISRLPIVKDLASAARNARNASRAKSAVGLGPIAGGQAIGPPPGLIGTLGSVGATDDRDQLRPGGAPRALPSRRAALPSSIGPPTLASALLQNQGTSPALKRTGRGRQSQNRALMIGP